MHGLFAAASRLSQCAEGSVVSLANVAVDCIYDTKEVLFAVLLSV